MRPFTAIIPVWILLYPFTLAAQGLFESGGTAEMQAIAETEYNGYLRAAGFVGPFLPATSSEIRSSYGEMALRMDAGGRKWAGMRAEVRFRSGYEYGREINQFALREAYADLDFGKIEFRLGQQILVWGRADAFNPTNNLTPQDYFVRSAAIDDMRMGNFLLRTRYHLSDQWRLEAVWVPVYRYSIFRFDLFEMPEYVQFRTSQRPRSTFNNGAFAAKLDFFFSKIDGSVSWFRGYDPMPGIQPGDFTAEPPFNFRLNARAFRQHTLGGDFSFGLGSYVVRGEAALRLPQQPDQTTIHVPGRDLRYVLELDRGIGTFSLSLMYAGVYVIDFMPLPVDGQIPALDPDPAQLADAGPMLEREIEGFNRIIFDQTREWSHTFMARPSAELFHQTVRIELFGGYNISTDEWKLLPRLTWHTTDQLKITLGGYFFDGPEGSLNAYVAPVFNTGFLEMRYSF